jgi:hypothetical protein
MSNIISTGTAAGEVAATATAAKKYNNKSFRIIAEYRLDCANINILLSTPNWQERGAISAFLENLSLVLL